jgi:hypothetical protein
VYELPYTIAAGLAQRHRIPEGEFLRRIAGRMSAAERLRLLGATEREGIVAEDVDRILARAPLTKLCLYVLGLSFDQRRARREQLEQALGACVERSLRRTLGQTGKRLGRVAAVLDRSFSSSGSEEKRRRPLGVAWGVSVLLRAAAQQYRAFWTSPLPPLQNGDAGEDELLVSPRGQTALAAPLLAALEYNPDLVVIVSDGHENDPPGAVTEVVRLFRAHIDRERRISIIHVNPVFDSERYAPRPLGEALPTIGLRDAEDLLTMLGFARFADGSAPLSELEAYLFSRLQRLLRRLRAKGEGESGIPSDPESEGDT